MKNIIAALLLTVAVSGCSTISGIFKKKTPHEEYADKLDRTDLEETPAGRQWKAASKAALLDPLAVELPYRHNGYFGPDKSRALGLKFQARPGERLTFTVSRKAYAPFTLFADLFRLKGTESSLVFSADTAASLFSVDIAEAGTYLLRLQPQLLRSGAYSLSIAVGPSLAFPVSGNKAKTGSFWGARRGGGKRSHEGIDIFAPRLTPCPAIADGVITGVKEGGLGGKVVWLKIPEKNIFLYYAHLDKQLVREGQQVKKGEIVGLVGNTGNARTTPSHLHFGVYTPAGPIDPFPFVNPAVKTAPNVPERDLSHYLRLTKVTGGASTVAKVNTLLVPVAVTAAGYIAELPDGKMIRVPFASVQTLPQPVTTNIALGAGEEEGRNKRRRR
ncbi:M23 family metallopeptidase [Paraflavisolibacter sp. H34]|uniref:M23 family metallopeptidase n=1 Tax=Huijunlia imazamoxiresistens TaxID=3127457 RepID=UPI003015A9EB